MDEAAHLRRAQLDGLKQHLRADHVGGREAERVAERVVHVRLGRQVDHGVDRVAVEHGAERRRVAHVANLEPKVGPVGDRPDVVARRAVALVVVADNKVLRVGQDKVSQQPRRTRGVLALQKSACFFVFLLENRRCLHESEAAGDEDGLDVGMGFEPRCPNMGALRGSIEGAGFSHAERWITREKKKNQKRSHGYLRSGGQPEKRQTVQE